MKRRRIIILGAGASASCGIAIARDILRASMLRLAKRDSAKATPVHDLLHYLYPGFNDDLSNYPNVEDFLNLVEMAKTFHTDAFMKSKKWSPTRLQDVMDITLRAITEYIWDFMADADRRRVLSGLIQELVRPGDVIVSFNWDFMIDLALEDDPRSLAIAYTYPADNSVVLLKPHGSIDWFQKDKLRKDPKLRSEMRHRATGVYFYPYFHLAENPDLVESLPFIVPPLAAKEYKGFLERIWRGIYRAVAAANELYIVGYSLPREDQFARLIIGLAIQRNNTRRKDGRNRLRVNVINPDESAVATFAKLVGTGVHFYQASIEDYVSWLHVQRETQG
jgi:hypothetical protein